MFLKAIVVIRIAHHNTIISMKAAPGDRKWKNTADHATLSNNCNKNSCIGPEVKLLCRQTSQAAAAIARNRIVQAGPNNQFGGVHRGLANPAYHGLSAGLVSREPSKAAPRHAAMEIVSRISVCARQEPELWPCSFTSFPSVFASDLLKQLFHAWMLANRGQELKL